MTNTGLPVLSSDSIGCVTCRQFCCTICSHEPLIKPQTCTHTETEPIKRRRQIHRINYEWILTTGLDSRSLLIWLYMTVYGNLWSVTHCTERYCVSMASFMLCAIEHAVNTELFWAKKHCKIQFSISFAVFLGLLFPHRISQTVIVKMMDFFLKLLSLGDSRTE